MSKKTAAKALLIIALLLFPTTLFGQQETATLTGGINDSSGSVIPKATITITNVATGISMKTESNESGSYSVPSLRPGTYSVTVEKQGFKKLVRTGLILQVNQVARIDLTLAVGDLTATVEVNAGDDGAPSFDHRIASDFASMGIPAFACTPDKFPDLMAAAIQRRDITVADQQNYTSWPAR